jgi:hypothetical protein
MIMSWYFYFISNVTIYSIIELTILQTKLSEYEHTDASNDKLEIILDYEQEGM